MLRTLFTTPYLIALIAAPLWSACEPEDDRSSIIEVREPGSPVPGKGSNNTMPPLADADAGQEPTLPPILLWDGGMLTLADSGEPESVAGPLCAHAKLFLRG